MAAVNRDGMEPVAYLYALADDPAVSVEHGSLNYLATQYGQHPDYVGYYQKAGTEIVPELVDTKLGEQGADFASATPEQIAYAVGELVTEASTPAQTEQPAQQAETAYPETPQVAEVPDEQILEQLATALGQDATEELYGTANEMFAQLTRALWKEITQELNAELREAAPTQQWASAEEAKAAATEAAFVALTTAIEGFWQATADAGGTLALYTRTVAQ